MLQLAQLIVRLTGSTSTIELVPRASDDPEKRRPDLTLAHSKLGYRPEVGPEEGLRRTIEFFRGGESAP
jgi:dTDP-glucose 4,6-dehydratase